MLTDAAVPGTGGQGSSGWSGGKRLLLKEPKIKKEKPLSGGKPQPAGGKSPVEGGAGNELGRNDPAWDPSHAFYCSYFFIINAVLSGTRPKPQVLLTSLALISFNVCFLNC